MGQYNNNNHPFQPSREIGIFSNIEDLNAENILESTNGMFLHRQNKDLYMNCNISLQNNQYKMDEENPKH